MIISSFTLLACGPVVATPEGDTSTGSGASSNPTTTSIPPDPSTTMPGTSADPTSATTGVDVDTGVDSVGEVSACVIADPDGGRGPIECSLWDEDCPRGLKCMPWANDGGNAWNATRCSPLDPDPQQVGESCTVVESGVSGIDDCELHSMCWDVDPDTLMGECVAFCIGSELEPSCADPASHCIITADGPLILCLPSCNPLVPTCNDGDECVPVNDEFSCVPDASGDAGAAGDDCEFINTCDPGLFCSNADSWPGCMGTGCCAPFCDLEAAMPCPVDPAGLECLPWYADPPAGYETLGACVLPA